MLLRLLAFCFTFLAVFAVEYQSINPSPPATVTAPEKRVSIPRRSVLPRTNAERLARGLPLLKPKFGRQLPGRLINERVSPVECTRAELLNRHNTFKFDLPFAFK